MEIVLDTSRCDHGKEMFTVLSFSDLAFSANNPNAVLHIVGVIGRQRLARNEGLACSGCRLRG